MPVVAPDTTQPHRGFDRVRFVAFSASEIIAGHPVATVVLLSIVVRVVAALLSFATHPNYQTTDERTYLEVAYRLADGRGPETFENGYGLEVYQQRWLFVTPLSLLAKVFGPNRLAGQLFVIGFGVLTVLLTTLIARRLLPAAGAVGAGLITALLPSQVLWSSFVLRDALVWAALGAVAWCILIALGTGGSRLALATAGIVAGLVTMGWLRPNTLLAAAWALPIAVLVAPTSRRLLRFSGAIVMAAVVPLATGMGIAGWTVIHRASSTLNQTRAVYSLHANSGFADPGAGDDTPVFSAEDSLTLADKNGIVSSELPRRVVDGKTYRVLSDAQGNELLVEDGMASNVRHLPAGLVATLLRPFPGESTSTLEARLASAENVVWYILYGMAAVGLWRCGWKMRRLLAFPLTVSAALVFQLALTEGNVGSAFRHRGQLVWALALFAALALPSGRVRLQCPSARGGFPPPEPAPEDEAGSRARAAASPDDLSDEKPPTTRRS